MENIKVDFRGARDKQLDKVLRRKSNHNYEFLVVYPDTWAGKTIAEYARGLL